jgi:hypothetical protein
MGIVGYIDVIYTKEHSPEARQIHTKGYSKSLYMPVRGRLRLPDFETIGT